MSLPGIKESLTRPIAVLPGALSSSITSIGVGYSLDPPSKSRTYCLIAKPIDPINPNILMWSDNPQEAKWLASDVSTTISVTDPYGGTDAWSAEADNVAAGDHIRQRFKHNGTERFYYAAPRDIIYSAPATFAARLTFQAGGAGTDDDTVEIGLYDEDATAFLGNVTITKLWGPGTVTTTARGALLEGLSETSWTQIEIYWSAGVSDGFLYQFRIYPGGYGTNDGKVNVYRPQVEYTKGEQSAAPVTGLVSTDPRKTEDRNTDDEISGGEVETFISNKGYSSHASDTPADTLFRAGLVVPYHMDVRLDSGDTFDKPPTANAGVIEISNTDGYFDRLLDYSWAGCSIEIYQGELWAPFSTFSKIFIGTCEDITWTKDNISLQLRDSTQKINKILQENLFGGFDQSLRGTGLAEIFQTTQHPTCWVHGDLTVECRIRMAAAPTNTSNVLAMYAGTGVAEADNAAFRFYLDTTNMRLVFGWQYSATPAWEQFTTANATIPTSWLTDDTWHHVAVTRDTEGKDLYAFIDGDEYSIKQDYTNDPTGGWTGLLSVGSNPAGSANEFDGDIDELRVWGVVRTEDEINSNRGTVIGAAHPDLLAYYRMDEGLSTTTYEETTLLAENDQLHRSIRWNGTDAVGVVADDDDLGPHSSFTIECIFYPGPYASSYNYYFWKGSSYVLYHRSSDDELVFGFWDTTGATFRTVTIDSSEEVDVTWGQGKRWLRIGVSWSDITQEFNTYVEGVLTKTYRNPAAGTTDWTAGDGGTAALRFGYDTSTYYMNWIADFRYWNAVIAPEDVAEWYDKALTSAHPNWSSNLQAWYDFNETSGDAPNQKTPTPPVGDVATTNETWVSTDGELDGSNAASWVGSGEGAVTMAGVPKPIALGQCLHVPLILVDPVKNVYFAAQGPLQADDGAFEGGVPLEGAAVGATDIWDATFEAEIDSCQTFDTPSTYVSYSTDTDDTTTGDVNLLPASPVVGDGVVFGYAATFAGVDLWMNVAAEGEATAWTWQYYNGSAWADLTGVRDYSDGFRELMSYIAWGEGDEAGGDKGDDLTGTSKDRVAIRWSIPSDWDNTTSFGGEGPYYWVRAIISTGSEPPSNIPKASAVWAIETDYVYDLNRGLYRLQSYPKYKVTAHLKGHASPTYVDEAGPMMWRLASEWGGLGATEKFHTLDDFGADVTLGFYVDAQRQNLLKALSQIASSVHGQPYINKAGALAAVSIPIPENEVPEFIITPEMWKEGTLQRLTTGLPSWQQNVGFQPYWGAYSRGDLNWARIQRAATVEDLQQPFRIVKGTKTRNKETWTGSPDNFVGTGIYNEEDAQAEADFRLALYGARRHLYSVSYPFGFGFAYDIGKVTRLDTDGRFNFDEAGRPMVVVGFQEDPVNQLITLLLWG